MSTRSLVVAAVDGSPDAIRTVEYAVRLARLDAAEVHAVQVVPRDGTLWIAPQSERALNARLRTVRSLAEGEGVALRVISLRGQPERAIPAYAQLAGASVVVVGRHYATSRIWRSTAVARRLSRRSPVPVIVLPRRMENAAAVVPKRVVAAVDFTVASAMALRTAVDLSQRHDASLTLVHAMDAPQAMLFSGSEAWRLVQQLPARMQVLEARLRRKAIAFGSRNAEPVVVTGDADHGIVETATATDADLIVMGIAPRTWIDEVLFGSTLRRVLRRARAPVLVVPVVAGAHEWIDEVTDDAHRNRSTVDALARQIA